jgi:copper transport protein
MRQFLTLSALGLIMAIGVGATSVSAHSRLDRAEPAPDTTLASSPAEVRLWFSQELTLSGNDITVSDASGTRVDNVDAHVDQSDPDRKQLVVTTATLGTGTYAVTWTSSSAEDGHPATDAYTFSVDESLQGAQKPTGCLLGTLNGES